jgi:hypothetical protein
MNCCWKVHILVLFTSLKGVIFSPLHAKITGLADEEEDDDDDGVEDDGEEGGGMGRQGKIPRCH